MARCVRPERGGRGQRSSSQTCSQLWRLPIWTIHYQKRRALREKALEIRASWTCLGSSLMPGARCLSMEISHQQDSHIEGLLLAYSADSRVMISRETVSKPHAMSDGRELCSFSALL